MNLLTKLQADASAFVSALFRPSPDALRFPNVRGGLPWPETPVGRAMDAALIVERGSPEHFIKLYFDDDESFYSADFQAGFNYMAHALLGRQAVTRPHLTLASAQYDAFQYGCSEAQDFVQSDTWLRALS